MGLRHYTLFSFSLGTGYGLQTAGSDVERGSSAKRFKVAKSLDVIKLIIILPKLISDLLRVAYTAVQRQKAVSAYLSKQILPFAFAEQYKCIHLKNIR